MGVLWKPSQYWNIWYSYRIQDKMSKLEYFRGGGKISLVFWNSCSCWCWRSSQQSCKFSGFKDILSDRIYLRSQTSWYWYQCHELLQITIFFQGGFLVRLSPHTSGLVISVKSYSEEAGQYRFPMISISKSRAIAKRLGSIGSSYPIIIKYSDNEQENAFTMDCFNIT